MQLIREYIQQVLINESKSATLVAQNLQDIGQALNWLRLNGKLKNAGNSTKKDNRHRVEIKFTGDKKSLIDFVKARFGIFVDIE